MTKLAERILEMPSKAQQLAIKLLEKKLDIMIAQAEYRKRRKDKIRKRMRNA